MPKLIVEKSPPLKGTVRISGAKNSALPIMAATLLSTDTCELKEVPNLRDVNVMTEVLRSLGAEVEKKNKESYDINSANINNVEAPYELMNKMRASFLVMGPLLARLGKARISMPGGCAIGTRPIDLHLKGFKALGAEIEVGHGYVEAKVDQLKGNRIYLDFPSVGATENIMMAASMAEGETILENVAQEPEIVDLANFLNKMGADIKGAGTNTMRINGVEKLSSCEHTIIPDRIEAGTYMTAAAMTGGDITIENVEIDHVKSIISKLKEAGIKFEEVANNSLRVIGPEVIKAVDVKTLPYPGFPTDMQSQVMALMSMAEGTSVIIETIFENRFMHVNELRRMGADIKIDGRSAIVTGTNNLMGAPVKATDLRAGAALILTGLISDDITEVNQIHHIDRGYSDIEEKLTKLGAKIRRVED
ncbi:UDP-N-acetylglucosamine 1-carboxyvinyltransferase [Clostridium sp. D2Q-11]|uniref:UDP-N-acetylglucosamine 1-carboxyvinyltransferase n=1 Tax=Anaeromonas frigoriresistens TaxID=2683708 RepID=A0A942UTK5_9FIRM|nr:UDP-N-acetylglucosamine 1-carboxyvinyltransferase [Anaeromonas frigoriresistens]